MPKFEIKSGDIVRCYSRDESEMFLEYVESLGILWANEALPTSINPHHNPACGFMDYMFDTENEQIYMRWSTENHLSFLPASMFINTMIDKNFSFNLLEELYK